MGRGLWEVGLRLRDMKGVRCFSLGVLGLSVKSSGFSLGGLRGSLGFLLGEQGG